MTNEKTSFENFRSRALRLRPDASARVLELAWERCAWTRVLTDERICKEIETVACGKALLAGGAAADGGVSRGEAYETAHAMPVTEGDAFLAGYYGRLRRRETERKLT